MSNNNGGLSGIELNEWREHERKLARTRHNARMKRSVLSRNALAAQMVTTGRGPKKLPKLPSDEFLPLLTKPPTQRLNAEAYPISNETRNILAFLSTVPVPAPASSAPVGGAGAAAPENTSALAILPQETRNLIASYISGAERNHLKPIKAKIAKETTKLRPRKRKTRRFRL
jgi:hypothetical protein